MKQFILIFGLLLFQGLNANAAILVNLGPDFKAYIEQYRNQPFEEQWAGWKDFETKYSAYLSTCDLSKPNCTKDRKNQLQKFYGKLSEIEPLMWEIFANAEILTAKYEAKMKTVFPDLTNDIPVVFVPSLFMFNGKVTYVKNKPTLFIAADEAAHTKENLDLLFIHEFFHAYHFTKLAGKPLFETFATPLWLEGFAEYITLLVYPEVTETESLMSEALAKYCADKNNLIAMARRYEKILPYSVSDAYPMYQEWFLVSEKKLINRTGYCLGLNVVREATKRLPLEKMIQLNEHEFQPLIGDILRDLR